MEEPREDNKTLTTSASVSSQHRGTGRRPYVETVLLGIALFGLSTIAILLMPDRSMSTRPAGWWAVVVVALGFALSEQNVLKFDFRREAIALSFSEVPMAFALVFLAPGMALGARLVGSVWVLLILRRSPAYKLFFNIGVFCLEVTVSFLLFRSLLAWWGDGDAQLIVSAIVAMTLTSTVGSVFVSMAISRFEGDALNRIKTE